MINININEYLGLKGQRVYSDGSLNSFTKDRLIDEIRCLEHNYAGEIWGSNLLSKRLENVCNYLKEQGLSLEEINKIISVEGE